MTDTKPGWKRMGFKGNKVWMAVDENRQPVEKNGKVLIKYQTEQDYEYWVYPKSLVAVEQMDDQEKTGHRKIRGGKKPVTNGATIAATRADQPENAVLVYTDGASSGNPGPSGIGVLLVYKENEKRISRFIGQATNNIAELKDDFDLYIMPGSSSNSIFPMRNGQNLVFVDAEAEQTLVIESYYNTVIEEMPMNIADLI